MPQKPRISKKESYLLILGVVLSFLVQIVYDVAHEFAQVPLGKIDINWYWIFLQFCFTVLFGLIAYFLLKNMKQD